MDTPTQTYRCSFSTLFLWTAAFLLVLDTLKMLLWQRVPLYELDLLHNGHIIVFASLISSAVLVFTLKSAISVEGISSYSIWGANSFIEWHKIKTVKQWHFFGLGYYQIRSTEDDCIYVARYLAHQREFDLVVTAITEQSNPLRRCIEGAK
jgi:hypothetical protein